MRLSPQRRAHAFSTVARVAWMPIVCVPEIVFLERFRIARAHTLRWFAMLKSQERCSGTIQDR
eukprot:5449491-Pyramimonas_sp.AAC.1